MTKQGNPAQWWHRALTWALSVAMTIGLSLVGYIAAKWDKSSDAVIAIGADVKWIKASNLEMQSDQKTMQKAQNEMRHDIDRIDGTVQAIKESRWFQRQVENEK